MNFEDLWARLGLDSLGATALTDTLGIAPTQLTPAPPVAPPQRDAVKLSLAPPRVRASDGAGDELSSASELVVVGELGKGGMGTVLHARQASLSRDVAVKVVRDDRSGVLANLLVEEARLAGSLEHPGIVPVHAIAFDGAGAPALVMRLVEGVSWGTLLLVSENVLQARLGRSAPNRLEAHLHVFLQVCNAVAFAHGRGVLHRDLKPANVLIGELGEVYVADWGVARRKAAPPGRFGLKGTPAYFAPEMCTGDDREMDERTDVFLLGATLFEVIEGNPPYYRAAGIRGALAAAMHGVIPPLPEDTPEELVSVVKRAMALEKAARFQSVLELRDAVATFLRHAASHRLAATARASLQKLETAVREGGTREQMTPLVSAARFGFMHSLSEWSDNAEAREGLETTLRLGAEYEVAAKNAAAARSLLLEMKAPPPQLVSRVEALEREDDEASKAVKQLKKMTHELDPHVSMRQRVVLFCSLAAAVTIASLGPALVPAWAALEASLGKWWLFARIAPSALVFTVCAVSMRKGLLGTRLNRRFMACLAASLVSLVANRLLCGALGIAPGHTMLIDMVVLATLAAGQGILLHLGFFVGCAVAAVMVPLALAFPGHERAFFSVAVVTAMVINLLTWSRWKSDVVPGSAQRTVAPP